MVMETTEKLASVIELPAVPNGLRADNELELLRERRRVLSQHYLQVHQRIARIIPEAYESQKSR